MGIKISLTWVYVASIKLSVTNRDGPSVVVSDVWSADIGVWIFVLSRCSWLIIPCQGGDTLSAWHIFTAVALPS